MFARLGWTPLLTVAGLTAGVVGVSSAHPSSAAPLHAYSTTRADAPEPLRFVTADSGNVARYRVREQLVGHDLKNDAVGVTGAVTGAITIGTDGKLIPAESKFTVDVKPLTSDQTRRDRYVQTRILETDKFRTVTLAATGVSGLPQPLPTSGTVTFQFMGDLTVHGTTKPTTWQATATVNGKQLSGTAKTAFTFADFGLLQPHVPVLLGVEDTIKLEYDFRLVRK